MNIFKSTRFTWWQLALLKWATFFFGLGIGALWPQVFAEYAQVLIVIGLVVGLYLGVVWIRGK